VAAHVDMSAIICEVAQVQIWSLLSRLLSILTIVSLLAASMVILSSVAPMNNATAAELSDTASMVDGMPCCPHEKPALPDCQKACPLAILCLAKCFPSAPAAWVVFPIRFAVADVKTPGDDFWRDRLRDPPPLKPPRV
jgi:hypothetical protein